MTERKNTSREPAQPAWRARLRRWHAFIVAGLLVVLFVQAAISAWQNSVTVDEFSTSVSPSTRPCGARATTS
jgi:cell division septal protein FtsQ